MPQERSIEATAGSMARCVDYLHLVARQLFGGLSSEEDAACFDRQLALWKTMSDGEKRLANLLAEGIFKGWLSP